MKSHLFPSGDVSLTIYREFREAAPPTEVAYRKWLDATSDRYGIPVQDLRAILANQEVQFIRKARNVVDTEAEVAGRFIGATLEKAIGVLNDQLGAEKWRPFSDKEGRLITEPCGGCAGEGRTKADGEQRYRKCKECDGKGGHVTYLRTPDNAARLAAVDKVLKIYGAFKPEKVEIDGHITFAELSVQDIGLRLKKLLPKLITLQAEPDVQQQLEAPHNGSNGASAEQGSSEQLG